MIRWLLDTINNTALKVPATTNYQPPTLECTTTSTHIAVDGLKLLHAVTEGNNLSGLCVMWIETRRGEREGTKAEKAGESRARKVREAQASWCWIRDTGCEHRL